MGKLFDKALAFATAKHAGQKRKFTGKDYITHPVAVAEIVREQGWPEWAQVIAVLHDVIEDCDVTHADLEERFGLHVADMVQRLSAKEGESYLDFILRAGACEETRIVKLADIQHNMSDMPTRNRTMRAKYELAGYILKHLSGKDSA